MKLEFDSVEDLQHFLDWAYVTRGLPTTLLSEREDTTMQAAHDKIGPRGCGQNLDFPRIDTAGVAFDTPPGEVVASGKTGAELAQQADAERGGDKSPEQPATRKRRTKAEIAADEKAASDALLAKQNNDVAAGLVQEAAALGAQQPDGTNPFEQVADAADGAASAADDTAAPDEPTDDAVVTPFQHLTRAREFIAKHGMPKYNESFTKAGLDANVMGYTADQRAQHMAALDALEKA